MSSRFILVACRLSLASWGDYSSVETCISGGVPQWLIRLAFLHVGGFLRGNLGHLGKRHGPSGRHSCGFRRLFRRSRVVLQPALLGGQLGCSEWHHVLRPLIYDCGCPVLKHGPRSSTHIRVLDILMIMCEMKVTFLVRYCYFTEGSGITGRSFWIWVERICAETRKMVNYTWGAWSQRKLWWKGS